MSPTEEKCRRLQAERDKARAALAAAKSDLERLEAAVYAATNQTVISAAFAALRANLTPQ